MKRLIPFFLGAALLVPITSSAVTFSDTCAPETEHSPGLLAPNLAFMLDKSGSMAADSSEAGKSRWEAAEEAINETVDAFTTPGACSSASDPNCDKVRFGLALFTTDAEFLVAVEEDTADDISSTLDANGPENLTAMGLAAELLASEPTLDDPTRSNHAVFITDGYPFVGCGFLGNQATLVDAVIALCAASNRANPLITSVIGFGGDTNEDTISFLAAAGGTGSCCDTNNCANTPMDVCAMDRTALEALILDVPFNFNGAECHVALPDPSLITCAGGIDIASNTQLKDAISGIVTAAACTFPLDIPAGYPDGAAQADPDYTRVELSHVVYGQVTIDNIGDCDAPTPTTSSFQSPEYDDEGWCFANDRKSIRVTKKLCEDIGSSDVDKVTTQVACICDLTGQACAITNVMCNGNPCTNAQLMNMPCSAGEYICDQGVDVCAPTGGGALPEICNGVDDNCDGIVDNLVDSEADWNSSQFASFKDTTALHCEFEDVCGCEGGAQANVTVNGGVVQLIADAIPECICQAGLEFEETASIQDESEAPNDSAAACSALSKDPSGLLYLLIPIGLVGFLRRRRKS